MKKIILLFFLTLFIVSSIWSSTASISAGNVQNNCVAIDIDSDYWHYPVERPNLNRTYDWYEYANTSELSNLNWPGPERATFFQMADFGILYPATIQQVSHLFYEHGSYPWDDATFHFKIYASDGSTLLHESGDLEAAHLVEYVYTLPTPLVVAGDFYVAIAPVSTSGHPSSTSTSAHWGHSYNGSAGAWTLYTGYEYITGAYLEGTAPTNPVLNVTPNPHDFGDVGLGYTPSQVFTIENIGSGSLIVNPAPSLTGDPEFTIINHSSTYPATIPPSITVEVQFAPLTAVPFSTTLTVISDAGTVNVPITGRGAAPDHGCPPDDTIWNQPPVNHDGGWTATTSCEALDYLVYDNFWGVEGQICDIHFWGMNLFYDAGWTECSNANTFNITFYNDNAGEPGTVVCEYLGITPSKTAIPNSDVDYGYWVYEYSYDFDPCCDLTAGWVSIQNTETDCYFLWINSPWFQWGYDGDEFAYQWNGTTLNPLDNDMAYCLTEADIVQPDPPQNLTITTTPNGVNPTDTDVHLEWDASPGATYYTVYKSSDPYVTFPGGWAQQATGVTDLFYDYISHNPPTFYRVTASN